MAKIELIKCTCCGSEKKSGEFYKSYSKIFKKNADSRMCLCKICILELYAYYLEKTSDRMQSVYEVCKKVDTYFDEKLFDAADIQCQGTNSNVCKIYFQKVNSLKQHQGLTFEDFDKSAYNLVEKVKTLEEEISDDIKNSKFTLTNEIIDFWGKGFTKEDYEFLSKEYCELCNRFECDSYSQEMLFQEISHQRLSIKKKRQNGDSVDKELKTLQDLLGSANIKPVQDNGINMSEQETFGTLLKKWENEAPVPEPLESWTSEDWIKKYISVWFFGHLSSMMGIKTDMSKLYEDEINNLTVSMEEDGENNEG